MVTPRPQHPLVRHGTHQHDRLAAALQPENLRLDDRSVADLLAFVAAFARHVRFWPLPAEDPGPGAGPGPAPPLDWSCFWQRDPTVLLALVAATEVRSFRTRYRDHELAYHRAQRQLDQGQPLAEGVPAPADSLRALVESIFAVARQLAFLCQQVPATHPLQAEIRRIVESRLRAPLGQLIGFHKGVVQRSLQDDYAPFIGIGPCQAPWGLPSNDEFFCLTFREPQDTDLDALWRLFLTFANALAVVVGKADKAFQYALHSRADHPPHVALLLAFLHLFRYLQDDLNALPTRHLLYYYLDVLRLAPRLATPDRAYLVFKLAQNQARYRLRAGTEFLGGPDRLGLARHYALEDELVLSQAVLLEKKSLYFFKATPEAATRVLAAPAADRKDGIAEPFAAGAQAWSAFGPKAYYQQLAQKLRHLEDFRGTAGKEADALPVAQLLARLTAQQSALETRPGLLIASPELRLEKSDLRRLTLTFEQDVSKLGFAVRLSTGATLSEVKPGVIGAELLAVLDRFVETGARPSSLNNQPLPEDLLADLGAVFQVENRTMQVYLPASFPAVQPLAAAAAALLADLDQPFLLLQPATPADYDALAARPLQSVQLQTASQNVRNLTLQLGDTVYPATAQLPLIGLTSGDSLNNLYVGVAEIAYKRLNKISVRVAGVEGGGELKPDASHPIKRLKETSVGVAGVEGRVGLKLAAPHATKLEGTELLSNGTWVALTPLATTSYAPPYAPPTPTYAAESQAGFVRLRLNTPQATDPQKPVTTDKLAGDEVRVAYVSAGVTINPLGLDVHRLYHYYPAFGFAPIKPGAETLAPRLRQAPPAALVDAPAPSAAPATLALAAAHGSLFLGFGQLVPGQTLSLLFQTAEGTGDPEKNPPYVAWSYLRHDEWVGLPRAFVLRDETAGLQQTGLLVLRLPLDLTDQNTFVVGGAPGEKPRKDLRWLRASATEGRDAAGAPDANAAIEALPLLVDVHAQAGAAVFQNHLNSLEHLAAGLPAGTITQLRVRDVNVRQVQQPYVSFGGRLPEGDDRAAYYRRVSERLRHRQRAVTVWDYERLVLERFPKIALAKCLPHTADDDVARAGQVTVAVVPYPGAMLGNRRFYPSVEAGQLTAIATYLNRCNSPFVSGLHCTTTCCCDDPGPDPDHNAGHNAGPGRDPTGAPAPAPASPPCGCHPGSALHVRNAVFEPVRLTLCVRFRAGKDPLFYRTELNTALKNFLAPWAGDATRPLLFGAPIQLTSLLGFLEGVDYVDVVTQLRVTQYASLAAARLGEAGPTVDFPAELVPLTPRSVLTTYLNTLDEDNPNRLDHLINYFEEDGCRCAGCLELSVKRFIADNFLALLAQSPAGGLEAARRQSAEALGNFLQRITAQGDLGGTPPNYPDFQDLPAEAPAGVAYWFKVEPAPPPAALAVTVLLTPPAATVFTRLIVTLPNPSPAHA